MDLGTRTVSIAMRPIQNKAGEGKIQGTLYVPEEVRVEGDLGTIEADVVVPDVEIGDVIAVNVIGFKENQIIAVDYDRSEVYINKVAVVYVKELAPIDVGSVIEEIGLNEADIGDDVIGEEEEIWVVEPVGLEMATLDFEEDSKCSGGREREKRGSERHFSEGNVEEVEV